MTPTIGAALPETLRWPVDASGFAICCEGPRQLRHHAGHRLAVQRAMTWTDSGAAGKVYDLKPEAVTEAPRLLKRAQ